MAHTQHNLTVALTLAEQGFFMFPCRGIGERRKEPCYGILSWRKQSTRDPLIIREWWRRWPDAVPAIDLDKSGLLVLDGDCRDGRRGIDWAEQHIGKGVLDCAPGSDTPSGGRHSAFRNRKDKPLGNGRGRLPPKSEALVDIRGEGGYVLAPGALFADGGYYAPRGDLRDALPIPESLLRYLIEPEQPAAAIEIPPAAGEHRTLPWGESALAGMADELRAMSIGEGCNDAANRVAYRAGRMVAGGLFSRSEAYRTLSQAVLSWGIKPNDRVLGQRGTIARALRDGAAKGAPITGPHDDDACLPPVTIHPEFFGEDVSHETPRMGTETNQEQPIVDKNPPEIGGVFSIGIASLPAPGDWSQPQGLLGEIADWIMATSRRPNRPLAVAAATATLSAICGRHLYGPTGTALNLYIVMLAQTSVGKDRPLDAPQALLAAAGFPQLWQSAKAFSVSAIEQRMIDYPCHLGVADEIDTSLLSRLSQNKYRPPHEIGMRSTILELWSRVQGKGPFSTTRRAKGEGITEPTVNIPSPSLTLLGAATHEAFYNVLSGTSIRDGFLNRFLLCHAGARGATQDVSVEALLVPAAIAEGLAALVPETGAGNIADAYGVFHLDAPLAQIEHRVPWADEGVEAAAKAFENTILALGDANAEEQPLLGRVFETAVRLAALHAVSRAALRTKAAVDKDDWAWGVAWAQQSARAMIEDAKLYMADSEAQAIARAIRRVLEGKGRVRRSELLKALDYKYKARDLTDTLKAMAEAGQVKEEEQATAKTGPKTRWYSWVG